MEGLAAFGFMVFIVVLALGCLGLITYATWMAASFLVEEVWRVPDPYGFAFKILCFVGIGTILALLSALVDRIRPRKA